jgi:hypothetical protein
MRKKQDEGVVGAVDPEVEFEKGVRCGRDDEQARILNFARGRAGNEFEKAVLRQFALDIQRGQHRS